MLLHAFAEPLQLLYCCALQETLLPVPHVPALFVPLAVVQVAVVPAAVLAAVSAAVSFAALLTIVVEIGCVLEELALPFVAALVVVAAVVAALRSAGGVVR